MLYQKLRAFTFSFFFFIWFEQKVKMRYQEMLNFPDTKDFKCFHTKFVPQLTEHLSAVHSLSLINVSILDIEPRKKWPAILKYTVLSSDNKTKRSDTCPRCRYLKLDEIKCILNIAATITSEETLTSSLWWYHKCENTKDATVPLLLLSGIKTDIHIRPPYPKLPSMVKWPDSRRMSEQLTDWRGKKPEDFLTGCLPFCQINGINLLSVPV